MTKVIDIYLCPMSNLNYQLLNSLTRGKHKMFGNDFGKHLANTQSIVFEKEPMYLS